MLSVEQLTLGSEELRLLTPENLIRECPKQVLLQILRELRRVVTHSKATRYKVASALVGLNGEMLIAPNHRGDTESNMCAERRLLLASQADVRFALCVNFLANEDVHFDNTSCGHCLQEMADRGEPKLGGGPLGDICIVSVIPRNEGSDFQLSSDAVMTFSELEDDGRGFIVNQSMRSILLPRPWRHARLASGDSPAGEKF